MKKYLIDHDHKRPLRPAEPHHGKLRRKGQTSARRMSGGYRRFKVQMLKARPLCALCRVEFATSIDHIVPVFKGGVDNLSNYQPICKRCHESKNSAEMRDKRAVETDIGYTPYDGWRQRPIHRGEG